MHEEKAREMREAHAILSALAEVVAKLDDAKDTVAHLERNRAALEAEAQALLLHNGTPGLIAALPGTVLRDRCGGRWRRLEEGAHHDNPKMDAPGERGTLVYERMLLTMATGLGPFTIDEAEQETP